MKVLLLTLDSPFLDNEYVFPYLGALKLLGVVQSMGKNVATITEFATLFGDCDMLYSPDYTRVHKNIYLEADVVGISATTPQAPQAYKILKQIKALNPEVKMAIGGAHATFYSDECAKNGFDIIVRGAGENIIKSWFNDGFIVKGIVESPYPKNDIKTYRDYSLLSNYSYLLNGEEATTMVTATGCPRSCAFCEHSRKASYRLPIDIFEKEVKEIAGMGYKAIMIFDDIFAMNHAQLEKYSSVLKKYNMMYRCFVHADIVDEKMLKMLKDSGCVEIAFGAESANQHILDIVDKRERVQDITALIEKAINIGLKVKAFFILGLPGETLVSIRDTKRMIKFYRTTYPDMFDFDCTIYFPFKGTKIGDSLRNNEKKYNLRLVKGLKWSTVDSTEFGSYKKKKGKSDTIIESFSWKKNKVIVTAEKLELEQKRILKMSARYKNKKVIEGNINSEGENNESTG